VGDQVFRIIYAFCVFFQKILFQKGLYKVKTLRGHDKKSMVKELRFISKDEMVSVGTDGTVRVWETGQSTKTSKQVLALFSIVSLFIFGWGV